MALNIDFALLRRFTALVRRKRLRLSWCDNLKTTYPWWAAGLFGCMAVGLAELIRVPFAPYLRGTVPFMTFLPAAVLIGYLVGARAGFVALAGSLLLVMFEFQAAGSTRSATEAVAALGAYSVVCGAGVALAARVRAKTAQLISSEHAKAEGEARFRLIAREFEHRLGNTMAVISTLAAMSAQQEESARDMLARFQPRLEAYGRAQRMLTKDQSDSVSLRDLIEAALLPFTDVEHPQILIELGELVFVSPAVATTLTLALHELATNAAKFGALSEPGGVARIRWRRSGKSTVNLIWIESDGPLVSHPTRTGFGSRLITQAIQSLPKASASLKFRPEGVSCDIELPTEPFTSSWFAALGAKEPMARHPI